MLCKINTHFVSRHAVRASTVVEADVPAISEDVRGDASGGNINDAIAHREVSPDCVLSCVTVSETKVNAENESLNVHLTADTDTGAEVKSRNPIDPAAGCQNSCSEDVKSVTVDVCPSTLNSKESNSQRPMMGSANTDTVVVGEPKVRNVHVEMAVVAQTAGAGMSMLPAHRSHSDSPIHILFFNSNCKECKKRIRTEINERNTLDSKSH
jgi:hypothetical protein